MSYTIVQHANATGSGVTMTVSLPAPSTTGNTLVLINEQFPGTSALTVPGSFVQLGASNPFTAYWYKNAPSTQSISVSSAGGSSDFNDWTLIEVNGLGATPSLDSFTVATSLTTMTITGPAVAQSSELLIASAELATGGTAMSTPAGWTIVSAFDAFRNETWWQTGPTAGTAPTFTTSQTPNTTTGAIMLLALIPGSGSNTPVTASSTFTLSESDAEVSAADSTPAVTASTSLNVTGTIANSQSLTSAGSNMAISGGKSAPLAISGQRYRLYHVGPRATVSPSSPANNQTLLARTDMVALRLPSADLLASPDWWTGQITGRLGDAGEATFTFPNQIASDGIPWRSRFDPTGRLQFLLVTDNGEIDFVGVIDQLAQVTPTQVTVHCSDGWWMLKNGYERDWTALYSPRDVIERATMLWVPAIVDNFPAGGLSSQWLVAQSGGGTVATGTSGGEQLKLTAAANETAEIDSVTVPVTPTGVWRGTASVQSVHLGTGADLYMQVSESGGTESYGVQLYNGWAYFFHNATGQNVARVQVPPAPSYSFLVESDGEWTWGYVNGQLIGCGIRRGQASTSSLQVSVALFNGSSGTAATATISGVLVESAQPFLQAGSDKGDYVLPGAANTYPSGGLHARYFNNLDMAQDTLRLQKIHHPSRTQAYAGSGTSEYANQQDTQINAQANPTPGASTQCWSVIWFGAIYLKLSSGNYQFQMATTGGAWLVRVGKLQFNTAIGSNWPSTTPFPATATTTFTLNAASLAGSLPYGGGTVVRDGWYPIRVEFAKDGAGVAPVLSFQPPVGYTDPGGTALTAGHMVTIPATSLSPLGTVDQRYQGISHFDLAQQTAQGYGHQMSLEPQTLESGGFPGVLAPRIREGHDTDIALKPDRGPRQDGEGIMNYSSTLDASDSIGSLQGNGAGLQNGSTGQLQSLVYDPATLQSSLFDVQGWQDFSDASFPSLLGALLNSQLGLRLQPWQALSADPVGRARWTNTWPLPGALAQMRWRPGDGLRIWAPDINVTDSAPRQMLVVTRNITPYGATQTQATFASRPRTPAFTLKRQLYQATRWQRNKQTTITTLSGTLQNVNISATSLDSGSSAVTFTAADNMVRAWLRVSFLNTTTNSTINIWVNGSDVTSTLNGPWQRGPFNLDISAVATQDAWNRMFVQVYNNTASTIAIQYQAFVDVTR